MSLDGGDRSPLIETDEVPGDDAMSIMSEKIIGADESEFRGPKQVTCIDEYSRIHDGEVYDDVTGS